MNAQPDLTALKSTKPGTFAGITYTIPDIDAGVDYWKHLNYKILKSTDGDVYMSDGTVLLNLKKAEQKKYILTYYSDNPEALSRQLQENGLIVQNNSIQAAKCDILITNKTEGITEPGGATLITMGPSDYMDESKYPNEKCGVFGEWAIPVKNIDESIEWWEKLGYTTSMKMNEPYPHAIMTDGYMIVGLHQTSDFNEPTLTYFAPHMGKKVSKLRDEGLSGINTTMGDTDNNVVLDTPGGQKVFLFSIGM